MVYGGDTHRWMKLYLSTQYASSQYFSLYKGLQSRILPLQCLVVLPAVGGLDVASDFDRRGEGDGVRNFSFQA